MNKHHQQEMEKYREKLWEMHKPDSTPREVQGCLQVMVELRSRIESLEKCSEKLKSEKETLEDSFRFHSAEQENMTLDLLEKMRELHAAGSGESVNLESKEELKKQKECSQTSFDFKIVERLQDLSTQLVKQTRELEQALADRTRQICTLRWELLHRDVSTVKLETELHRAQIQGASPQIRSTWDSKRAKYAHFRSWSSEEASNRSRQLQECGMQNKGRPKAGDLPESYYKLPKSDFQARELSNTVQELNRELIRLSTAATGDAFLCGSQNMRYDEVDPNASKEINANPQCSELRNTCEESNATSQSVDLTESLVSVEPSEMRASKISVRRNSAGSISITSGVEPGGSESSSVNDDSNRRIAIKKSSPSVYHKLLYRTSWTDSESSTEEENFTRISFLDRSESCGTTVRSTDQDMILKQLISKKKIYHTPDSDESRSISEETISNNKRKINYKTFKTARKLHSRNGQIFVSNNSTTKQHSSTQSESDNTVNIAPLVNSKECLKSNRTANEIIPRAPADKYFLRSCHSADQVTSKCAMQGKLERTPRNVPLIKDPNNRPSKSHAVKSSLSFDSKIPKSNRINVKKSASCHEKSDRHKETREDDFRMLSRTCEPLKLEKDANNKSNTTREKNGEAGKISNVKTKYFDECVECGTTSKSNDTNSTKDSINDQSSNPEAISQVQNDHQTRVTPRVKRKKMNKCSFITERSCEIGENYSKCVEKNSTNCEEQNAFLTETVPVKSEAVPVAEPSLVLKLPKKKYKTQQMDSWTASEQQNCSQRNHFKDQPAVTETLKVPLNIMGNRTQMTEYSYSLNTFSLDNDQCLEKRLNDSFTNTSKSGEKEVGQLKSSNLSLNQQLDSWARKENQYHGNTRHPSYNSTCTSKEKESGSNYKMRKDGQSNYSFSRETKTSKCAIKTFEGKNLSRLHSHEKNENKYENDCLNYSNDMSAKQNNLSLGLEEKLKGKTNYVKSTSAPQLDWKKACAKKISLQGAPNVKTLIEKYNQKVLENQLHSPCSSNYNSPAISRKISDSPAINYKHEIKTISFSSTSCSPKIPASSFHTSLTFTPMNLGVLPSPMPSPPISPSSKARSEALMKAKEKFISSSNIFTIVKDNSPKAETPATIYVAGLQNCISPNESDLDGTKSTKRSATDSELTKRQNHSERGNDLFDKDNRKSICSTKSSDSMNLVLCKTGETCQETRFLKRCDKHKALENQSKEQKQPLKTSKSLSTSSVFKTVTGHDIKLPPSFLRLRRSRKKKDMSTGSQLCRQSLLLGSESTSVSISETSKSPRSCPSSPELKIKNKSKPSWFQRNIFKLK